MKKIITLPFVLTVFIYCICMTAVNAQTTLTLQPGTADGKDATIDSYSPNLNTGSSGEINAQAWTVNGNYGNSRGLIGFDLSSIPVNAIIQSAYLTLYNNPVSSNGLQNGQHSHLTGSNASQLQRITSPWAESTCTWNTQPYYTNQNEVILPQDTNPNQDYIVNVAALVQDMIANPSTSFGFMLKQQVETPYHCLLFASSEYPDVAKHPKLVVTYVIPCVNVLSLQPNGADGKDVVIDSYASNWNGANAQEFNAQAWTTGGNLTNQRGLIDFNLSSLPAGAIIQSAYLTLYNHPTSSNGLQDGKHSHLTGSNASQLQRIITPWSESTCTWNTQPSYTSQNEVILPQDTDPNQDYIVNVKILILDMIANPSSSYGFMLKQQVESPYHCLLFTSSDYPNPGRRPKLVITYTVPAVAAVTPAGTVYICSGTSTTLSASAGVGYTYKWYRNNVLLSTTTRTFTTATKGTYKCVVTSGSCSSATSNSVVVSVINNPTPTITAGGPTTFCAGGSVIFTANALTGAIYQWQKNSVNIAGATAQTYTANSAGSYRVMETKSGCSKYSSKKTVKVNCRMGDETADELSSDEEDSEIAMNVFPNPFVDKLNVEISSPFTEQIEIKVMDVLGKIQYKQVVNTNATTELNLPVPTGVYMITSTVNGKSTVVRVVKTR